jgi:hypothetical protein
LSLRLLALPLLLIRTLGGLALLLGQLSLLPHLFVTLRVGQDVEEAILEIPMQADQLGG